MVKDILLIAQARMGSTRLPGKTLKMMGNLPVLGHLIARLKKSANMPRIKFIIATSHLPIDTPIEEYCLKNDVECFRGDPLNVLSRFYDIQQNAPEANMIIRTTADCPLIDPQIMDKMIEKFEQNPEWEFLCNTHCKYGKGYPSGFDIEIASKKCFEKLCDEVFELPDADILKKRYTEHVMVYIRDNHHHFSYHEIYPELLENDKADADDNTKKEKNLSVDTIDDFNLINIIISSGPMVSYDEITKFIKNYNGN